MLLRICRRRPVWWLCLKVSLNLILQTILELNPDWNVSLLYFQRMADPNSDLVDVWLKIKGVRLVGDA